MQYSGLGSPPSSFIDPCALYRTTDGAATWKAVNIGELSSAAHAVITQMRFVSPAHGYMTAVVSDTPSLFSGGLYETTDSGSNWRRITPNRFGFESLAISGSKIFLVKFGYPLGAFPDSIVIFDTATRTFFEVPHGGVSIVSNGNSIVYSHHLGYTMRSTTGGLSWTRMETGASSFESWSLYAIPNSTIIIRASEVNYGQLSEIDRSSDSGASWQAVYSFPNNPNTPAIGDIDGDGGAIYLQLTKGAYPDSGLLRSTDSGLTWQQVNGPIHRCDSRSLSVVDCGAVVYAVDDSDWWDNKYAPLPFVRLWRTSDGGDGALQQRAYNPSLATDTIPKISLCNSSTGLVEIFSNRCSVEWELDDISLSGDTVDFRLDSIPTLPETFGGAATDSFYVQFTPSNHVGAFSTSLHLHFVSLAPDSDQIYDTTITLNASAIAPPIQFSSAITALDFGALSTCTGKGDSTIIFTNFGCSPDTITSLSLLGTGFTGNDSIPIIVQPGDSISLHYQFLPPDSGAFSGTVKLHVTSMGLTEDPIISLTGRGIQGMGALDVRSTSLQAGSFSFCAGDTTLTDTLRNTGCDTLVISNIRFGGDSAFSLASSPGDSLLLPGASGLFQFYFAPRVKGSHTATLSFHSRNIVNDPGHDTTVTIFGTGLPGTTALSADTTTRNFGALFECEERDTTIWLKNPGCDTLRVDSAVFSNASYSPDTAFPIFIAGNDSVAVRIHLASAASPMNGAVTFYSNANTGPGTGTVPLRATAIPPAQLRLSLSPADSGKDGQAVTFYVILTGDTGAAARELMGITFDLTHNDDLLSFLKATGVTVSGTGNILHIAWGSPSSLPDTIGTLTFQVYLTDSSTTPLTLSNISFQTTDSLPADCIASFGNAGSGFTYLYQCGDHELQTYLLTGNVPFTIESIVPNPAESEIRVSGIGSGVSAELVDALGRTVIPSALYPLPFPLDVSGLPSGIYFLRLSENGYTVSRSVSISR